MITIATVAEVCIIKVITALQRVTLQAGILQVIILTAPTTAGNLYINIIHTKVLILGNY